MYQSSDHDNLSARLRASVIGARDHMRAVWGTCANTGRTSRTWTSGLSPANRYNSVERECKASQLHWASISSLQSSGKTLSEVRQQIARGECSSQYHEGSWRDASCLVHEGTCRAGVWQISRSGRGAQARQLAACGLIPSSALSSTQSRVPLADIVTQTTADTYHSLMLPLIILVCFPRCV